MSLDFQASYPAHFASRALGCMCLFCSKTWHIWHDTSNQNIFFSLVTFRWVSSTPFGLPFHLGMLFHSCITHFLGSTFFSLTFFSQNGSYLFSFKYHSFRTGWRILLDSEYLWSLFNGDNKWCQRRGCGGEAPASIREHCSVSGQVRVRIGQVRLGQVQEI